MQSQNKREGESENSHFLFAANVTPPACVDSVSFMVEQSCTFVQRAVRVYLRVQRYTTVTRGPTLYGKVITSGNRYVRTPNESIIRKYFRTFVRKYFLPKVRSKQAYKRVVRTYLRRYVLPYFRNTYFRKYESTFVLSYFRNNLLSSGNNTSFRTTFVLSSGNNTSFRTTTYEDTFGSRYSCT